MSQFTGKLHHLGRQERFITISPLNGLHYVLTTFAAFDMTQTNPSTRGPSDQLASDVYICCKQLQQFQASTLIFPR